MVGRWRQAQRAAPLVSGLERAFQSLRAEARAAEGHPMIPLFIASWKIEIYPLAAFLTEPKKKRASPLALQLRGRLAELTDQQLRSALELVGLHWPFLFLAVEHNAERARPSFSDDGVGLQQQAARLYARVIKADTNSANFFEALADAQAKPDGSAEYNFKLYFALSDLLVGAENRVADLAAPLILFEYLSNSWDDFRAAVEEENIHEASTSRSHHATEVSQLSPSTQSQGAMPTGALDPRVAHLITRGFDVDWSDIAVQIYRDPAELVPNFSSGATIALDLYGQVLLEAIKTDGTTSVRRPVTEQDAAGTLGDYVTYGYLSARRVMGTIDKPMSSEGRISDPTEAAREIMRRADQLDSQKLLVLAGPNLERSFLEINIDRLQSALEQRDPKVTAYFALTKGLAVAAAEEEFFGTEAE